MPNARRNSYARSDQVRVHLFMDRVGTAVPDPLYYPTMGVDAVSHDLGDVTPVEVPDPDRYGEFIDVDGIPGQKSRWTSTLTTYMPIGVESPLRQLERRGNCTIDIHLTRGICDVPTDINQFAELEIWEDVRLTSFSTGQLAALSSDQREATTEQADLSIGMAYKIYNMLYGLVAAPSEADATPKGIVMAPSWCCEGSECGVMFVASAGNLYFCTKTACDATAYGGADIGGIVAVGNRIAVARSAVGLDIVQYDRNGVVNVTTVDVENFGTVAAIGSNGRYGVVACALKIYKFDATASNVVSADVTSLAGGSATKVAALSVAPDGTAVGLSDKAYPMYSTDGIEWKQGTVLPGTTPVGTAVCALSQETWLAGTSTGEIYLTSDSGASWTKVLDVSAAVNDIKRVTNHVVYAAIGSSLYRSVDGGASWSLEPNVVGRTFVNVTSVNWLAPCPDNYNNIAMACVASSAVRVVTGRPG